MLDSELIAELRRQIQDGLVMFDRWSAEQLLDLIDRLRLERDMLSLNPARKGPAVFSVMGADGNVSGVVWSDSQQATDRELVFPKWYREAAENGAT